MEIVVSMMKISVIAFAVIIWVSTGNIIADDFSAQLVRRHNHYRAKHGVPELTLNDTISKFSQEWADSLATRDIMEHSQNERYGENLHSLVSTNKDYVLSADEPADSWYSEIRMYNYFNREPPTGRIPDVGHFTQLVWRESRYVGVGLAKNISGGAVKYYVVCNYWPRGNVLGEFAQNVLPSKAMTNESAGRNLILCYFFFWLVVIPFSTG